MEVQNVLDNVHRKGVRLWAENGTLHYSAPKGALTGEEMECLRLSKAEIVALLECGTAARSAIESRKRAPLSFAQLTHWNIIQLGERRTARDIASATRLSGPLSLAALRRSVAEVVRRHEALRTRIFSIDGVPFQQILESGDTPLHVVDLECIAPAEREIEVQRLIQESVSQPTDLAKDPLFAASLLKLSRTEHVLILSMEHMISDAYSMSVLTRDIFLAYVQVVNGGAIALPGIPVRFADYAAWQQGTLPQWVQRHRAYWHERLDGVRVVRFPVREPWKNGGRLGWDCVPIRIGKDLRAKLLEWSRANRTTLVLSVFTAYVALTMHWCDAKELVLQFQTDGRPGPQFENTVGFFASVLFLRIALEDRGTFRDLLAQVTREYCGAFDHADASYLEAQVPLPEYARSACFNWVPAPPCRELSQLAEAGQSLECSSVAFENPSPQGYRFDKDPALVLYDTGEEIVGGVYFALDRFSVESMEAYGAGFFKFMEKLLTRPQDAV